MGHHRDLGLMMTPHLGCLGWTEDAALAKLAQHDGGRRCLFSL